MKRKLSCKKYFENKLVYALFILLETQNKWSALRGFFCFFFQNQAEKFLNFWMTNFWGFLNKKKWEATQQSALGYKNVTSKLTFMNIISSFVLSSQPEILQYFLIFTNYETGDSYKSVLMK